MGNTLVIELINQILEKYFSHQPRKSKSSNSESSVSVKSKTQRN